jgi:hypothetical protein
MAERHPSKWSLFHLSPQAEEQAQESGKDSHPAETKSSAGA